MRIGKKLTVAALLLVNMPVFAGPTVKPTPEITAAAKKFTEAQITKVEIGFSGLTPVYEVKFDKSQGGIREIEFTQKDHKIVSAEGHSLTQDNFNPGSDLSTLKDLASALQKYPEFTPTEWELEKKSDRWVYEVSGLENNIEKEYHFDAKDLTLIKTKND